MAVERRLDQVESALSGRDRARLAVQAASNGEEPDERLDRYCPASERGQFEAIKKAVTKGITETWQRVLFEIEWLNNDDVSLGWLECIAAFLAREKALKKLAGAQAKSIPAMPPLGRGFLTGEIQRRKRLMRRPIEIAKHLYPMRRGAIAEIEMLA